MRYLLIIRAVWKIGKILKFCQNITSEAMILFYYEILDSLHNERDFSCKDLCKGIGQKIRILLQLQSLKFYAFVKL